MWLSDEWKDYEVIDTSSGEKLERWGKYILVRPDPQVIWDTPKKEKGQRKSKRWPSVLMVPATGIEPATH